ncbi:hypothetical protein PInf_015188 [Phytophthora infestans]|nr:hypothetical protein PInf_015188 [Phytophthora infestans]
MPGASATMKEPPAVDVDALLPETPVGAIATLTSARDKAQALARAQHPPRLFGGYLRKRYSSSMYMGCASTLVPQQGMRRDGHTMRGEVWVQSIESWDGRTALGTYPHAFAVRTTSKKLLLCTAETQQDRDRWLQHLERALQRSKNTAELLAAVSSDDGGRRIVPGDMRPPPTPCAFQERPAAGSDATSIRSAPSDLTYGQSLALGDAGCAECFVRFRPLMTRRVLCGSCARAFCARHVTTAFVCNILDFGRQDAAATTEFISYLRSSKRFLGPLASRGISMDALVARTDARNQTGDMFARTLHKLRHGSMTLNKTIKILYQTRKKPHLFRVACERLPFYTETCVDRVENLCASLFGSAVLSAAIHPCNLSSLSSNCTADDLARPGVRGGRKLPQSTPTHAAIAAGLHLPNTTLPESSRMFSIWKDLVFADCPEHQLAQILADLREINAHMEKLISLEPDSMNERWLNARTLPQFENCAAELAASGIELCEFQSSILYDSLDVDTCRTGIESLVLEQVSFVQSLAAISERLRHIQPVSDRGKYLAGELETLNNSLQSSALYPLSAASDELYQVVRIPPTEGKSGGAIGLDDTDKERLRPFVFSSHPRNSTFFESAVLDEIEASAVSSSGETMLSPYSSSTLATPTPTSNVVACPDDGAASGAGSEGLLDRHTNGRDAAAPATGRRHTGIIPHLPQPSRGSKMGAGARAGRLGIENFVYDSKIFGESWEERKARIRSESPMGELPGWDLFSVIVKTNDDLRQEVFTMQLIHKLKSIFEFEAPQLWLRTYRIVATGANIGLLETITDACSLDYLKKTFPGGNLSEYFRSVYGGDPSNSDFIAAQRRFIESMAAYSIVSYVLLLKDRHNGNILLSSEGRVIHIDFGFILGIAPGGMFSIEDAPFKLTKEMVDVMGGLGSHGYKHFRNCLCEGFVVLQKYHSEIAALLQTTGQHSPFPCFHGAKLARVIASLRTRLCVGLSRREIRRRVDHLIRKSYNAWGTRQYDSFQLRSNNIHP